MRNKIVLICLIFAFLKSFGQICSVQKDSLSQNSCIDANIKKISKTSNKIEIRFYKINALSSECQLVLITNKKNKWKCRLINNSLEHGKYKTTDSLVIPKISYDSLFSALKINKIFELTSDSILFRSIVLPKVNGYDVPLLFPDDGCVYYVETKDCEGLIRTYKFNNPILTHSILLKYNIEIQELNSFIRLLNVIKNNISNDF